MTEKVRVDVSDMTLREMADATAAAGDVEAAGGSFLQMAAMAWVVKRRTDPTFSFDDALALRMGDLDIVEQAPEVRSGVIGVAPPPLPGSGELARAQ